MTKQFRNSKGWQANKSNYWYRLVAKQEFIQELFMSIRELRRLYQEQHGGLWKSSRKYSYYLRCEKGIL